MVYWGRNAKETIKDWKIPKFIDFNLEEALYTSGIKTALWMPVLIGPTCSCVKDGAADVNCYTCYGRKIVGGFRRYGYEYIELASTDDSLVYSEDEVELNQNLRPYRLQLKDSVDYAEIITSDYTPFVFQSDLLNMEHGLKVYDREGQVGCQFSLDGADWLDISALDGQNISAGTTIKFKIILSRSSGARTPLFELLRVRGAYSDLIIDLRKKFFDFSIIAPFILISRTRSPGDEGKEQWGLKDIETGISYWTLQDFEILSHSFMEIIEAENPFYGKRYPLFNIIRSFWWENRYRQLFNARLVSRDMEIYERVF